MADTIFYGITNTVDCDCYLLEDEQVGDCINVSACQCLFGEYDLVYVAPTAPTWFEEDNITPSGNLYDDGFFIITIDTDQEVYNNQNLACSFPGHEPPVIEQSNIYAFYRVPSDVNFGEINDYISVPTSDVTVTFIGDGLHDITINNIIAQYEDEYNASSRYVLQIIDNNGCIYNMYINENYGYVAQILYEQVSSPTESFYNCVGDEFNGIITIRNYSGGEEGLTNGLIIPSGTTFTLWADPETVVLPNYFTSFTVLHDGNITSLLATGTTSIINDIGFVGIPYAPIDSYGFEITLTTDWLPLEEIVITMYNDVSVDCSAVDILNAAGNGFNFQFPETFYYPEQILTVVLPDYTP